MFTTSEIKTPMPTAPTTPTRFSLTPQQSCQVQQQQEKFQEPENQYSPPK